MDIQQYIAADKELLLNLNGSQSLFWDGFMWVATSTIVWVPVAAMLLYIIIKNNKIQEALLTIVMIALVITLADQIASGYEAKSSSSISVYNINHIHNIGVLCWAETYENRFA